MQLKSFSSLLLGAAITAFGWPALLVPSSAMGGVSVGNAGGQKLYWSPVGQFAVRFDASLSLSAQSDAAFAITNSTHVTGQEPTSSVSFAVSAGDPEAAAALARRQNPSRQFAPVAINGLSGLVSTLNTGDHISALYLLKNSDRLITAQLEAFAQGDGLALIAPIVETLAPDTAPPLITGLHFDNDVWTAGSTQTVHFQAHDDVSGVRALGWIRLYQLDANGNVMPNGLEVDAGGWSYSSSNITSEGNDWYAWQMPLDAHLPNGNFVVESFGADDQAKNFGLYVLPGSQSDLAARPLPDSYWHDGTPTGIPLQKIRIVNPTGNVDATPPVLHGFQPDTSVWEAGSTHKIYFKITDDNTGLDVGNTTFFGLRTKDHEFSIGSPTVVSEGGDWYSVAVQVPAYQPSGLYYSWEILMNDGAGNSTTGSPDPDPGLQKMFTVQVRNPGQEDRQQPKVDQWRLESPTLAPGQIQHLFLHVTSGPSGMEEMRVDMGNGDVDVDLTNGDSGKPLGNDWYSLEIPTGPYMAAGDYFVQEVYIVSGVGKELFLNCDANSCHADGESMPLALLPPSFKLVR